MDGDDLRAIVRVAADIRRAVSARDKLRAGARRHIADVRDHGHRAAIIARAAAGKIRHRHVAIALHRHRRGTRQHWRRGVMNGDDLGAIVRVAAGVRRTVSARDDLRAGADRHVADMGDHGRRAAIVAGAAAGKIRHRHVAIALHRQRRGAGQHRRCGVMHGDDLRAIVRVATGVRSTIGAGD